METFKTQCTYITGLGTTLSVTCDEECGIQIRHDDVEITMTTDEIDTLILMLKTVTAGVKNEKV